MNRKVKSLIGCIIALCLIGCASVPTPKSQEEAYFEALRFYNICGESYRFHFALASEDTQAKWIANINPVFMRASDILDVWGEALTAGESSTDAMSKWTKIKRELIVLLSNAKITGGQK